MIIDNVCEEAVNAYYQASNRDRAELVQLLENQLLLPRQQENMIAKDKLMKLMDQIGECNKNTPVEELAKDLGVPVGDIA